MTLLLLLGLFLQDPSQDGARAMREGRFDDAARIYRQLIQQVPGESRLYLNLGLALHSAKRYKDAIPEFERFLKANPAPGPAYLLLGLSRLKLNQACEAVGPLEKARKWQASADVLIELADAYSGCQRWGDAARTYGEAARLKPADTRLPRASARAYWQARDYAPAAKLFASLEAAHSSDPEFLYEYGDTLARLNGAESGLPYLERAVKAAPGLAPAHGALGRALLELDRAAESIPHLEAGAPADAALLLPLSKAYRAVGRTADAARVEKEYRAKVGN